MMISKIAVLAAGSPHFGVDPSVFQRVSDQSVLDWQLYSFSQVNAQIDLVLGFNYQVESSDKCYSVIVNEEWESTGSAGSLALVDIQGVDELWVSYGDIVYHPEAVDLVSSSGGDAVVAFDSDWRTRYLGRGSDNINGAEKVIMLDDKVQCLGSGVGADWASGEFVGLACLRGKSLDIFRWLKLNQPKRLEKLSLPDLLEVMRTRGAELIGVDLKGQWAELNESRDLAHFVMGTKAETLARLRMMVKQSTIQDQVCFSVTDWNNGRQGVLVKIFKDLIFDRLVVRSSALSEDSFTHSNAGAYTSVLDVGCDEAEVSLAIDTVIASYDSIQDSDQVLVQPMLSDVAMSGVVFTRALESGAPYFVINYDESGSTESITSGRSKEHSVFVFFKDTKDGKIECPKLRKLISAVREIEGLLNYDALDIEFAINGEHEVNIFQVRPMSLLGTIPSGLDAAVSSVLKQASAKFSDLQSTVTPLVGSVAIFGNMPDWNPAEIIGTNPNLLAYTLYRYLILDEIWSQQRAEYGYRDVRPVNLLQQFAGKPYVDVRASFNSFIPAELGEDLAFRLVNFYTKWLIDNPHLHDKVEFEVIPTCLSLGFDGWVHRLSFYGGFSSREISHVKQGLLKITNDAIARVEADLSDVSTLSDKLDFFPLGELESLVQIKALLDQCKRLGTLPFAHLARAGFIAMTFLRDGLSLGILSQKAFDGFLSSIRTVSKELGEDALQVKCGSRSELHFFEKYGHLRPGTYDITSLAYHEDVDRFLRPIIENSRPEVEPDSQFWDKEKGGFFDGLREIGIAYSDEDIENFMRLAIQGREKAKFIFTRSLSKALDGLVKWASLHGISRDEVADLSVLRIMSHADNMPLAGAQRDALLVEAKLQKAERELAATCLLPPLLTSDLDFSFFTLNESQPNYIGVNKITADVVDLECESKSILVRGKIVMIPQADPGYDWLFGQGMVGLITMYGGANSHMAIRSAEYGLPAAIGVGESFYRTLSSAQSLELDPSNSIVRVIN